MEKDTLSITYAKNLEKHNFSSTLNLQIDSKVNIKTVLNVNCYIYDEKIESASGKAVISGKLGVKVLYIDTDNITNTLTDVQPFSETIIDNSITTDCCMMLTSVSNLCKEVSSDSVLKVECNISFVPVVYVNLALPCNPNLDEQTICRNSNFTTNTIVNKINTSFNYTTNLETQNNISKILNSNSRFSLGSVSAQDGYTIVEGKLFTCVIYETEENEETRIKQLCDIFNVKTDLELPDLKQDSILDLNFTLDNSAETITTELEDNNSVITINHEIKVKGLELKEVNVDCVEDLYSTKNELEISKTSREFICETKSNCFNESIVGEVSLNKDEPVIEDIIANLNPNAEITNTYIKNKTIHFEGLINSTVVYVDEVKELKSKVVEIPFVVNSKIEMDILPVNHINITLNTSKIRARRGTIIEIEYDMEICLNLFKSANKELIDNVTVGKVIDYSQYDYQI